MFGDLLSSDYVRRVTTMDLVIIVPPAQTLLTNSWGGEWTRKNKRWRKTCSQGK